MMARKKSLMKSKDGNSGKVKNFSKVLILLLIVILLITSPMILKPNAEFAGTDDGAKNTITEIRKDYKPWFSPFWEPPSKEIESLLFTLQASIGAAVIAFYLGYLMGKNRDP